MVMVKKTNSIGYDELTVQVQEALLREGIEKPRVQIKREIQLLFKIMALHLDAGKTIELREFGIFDSFIWDGHFPVTGEYVGKRRIVKFTSSDKLKKLINRRFLESADNITEPPALD